MYWRMHTTIIVIAVFVGVLVVLAFFGRNATLDKLALNQNEQILLRDDAPWSKEMLRGTDDIFAQFPNVRVLVTNQRIIIGQKILFRSDKYAIRQIIDYTHSGTPLSQTDFMGGALVKSHGQPYMTFYTTPDRVTFSTVDGASLVQITVPFPDHGPLLREPKIVIKTNNIDQYRKIFGGG